MARLAGRDVLDLVLRGGEDYELLFAAATDPRPVLAEAVPGLWVTRIGEVLAGDPVPRLVHADGREETLAGGFDHLAGPYMRASGGLPDHPGSLWRGSRDSGGEPK